MAATSLLARLGIRLATLGSAASLAYAAPVAEGDLRQDAHTYAARTGWFHPTATSIGFVANGVEQLMITGADNTVSIQAGSTFVLAPRALPDTPAAGMVVVDSSAANALKWYNGTAWQSAGVGGGTPAGVDTQVQYNNAGAFGASADLVFTALSGLYARRTAVAASGMTTLRADTTLAASGIGAGVATDAYFIITRTPASGEVANVSMRAVSADARHLGSNASASATSVTALYYSTENSASAGSISLAAGINGGVTTQAGSTTTNVYGVGHSTYANGAITNWYGLSAACGGPGAVTNAYGAYVDVSGFTNVTNRYGVYQVGATALNYFAGMVSINVAPLAGVPLYIGGTTAHGINIGNTIVGAGGTSFSSMVLWNTHSPSVAIYQSYGVQCITETNAASSAYLADTYCRGGLFEYRFKAETSTNFAGATVVGVDVFPRLITDTVGVTLGAMYGLHVRGGANSPGATGTATLTTYCGLRIDAFDNSGGIATLTNNYAIYQGDTAARNHFAGNNVLVPKVLPAGAVAGMVVIDSGDANLLKWYNGSLWLSAGPSQDNLTDAATVNYDASAATGFNLLLTTAVGSSRQLATPTGLIAGASWLVRVQQPSSGGPCTLTFSAAYKFPFGLTPTFSTSASAVDTVSCYYDGTVIFAHVINSYGTSSDVVITGDSLNLSNILVSTNTTLDVGHHTICVDASAGPVTITLPATSIAGVPGIIYHVKKVDASANAVTIQRSGSDVIDGATTVVLTVQYQTRSLHARTAGLVWDII